MQEVVSVYVDTPEHKCVEIREYLYPFVALNGPIITGFTNAKFSRLTTITAHQSRSHTGNLSAGSDNSSRVINTHLPRD